MIVTVPGPYRTKAKVVSDSNATATTSLSDQKSVMSAERAAFVAWRDGELESGAKRSQERMTALRDVKMNLVRGLSELYPIHLMDHGMATIRWVSLPDFGKVQ